MAHAPRLVTGNYCEQCGEFFAIDQTEMPKMIGQVHWRHRRGESAPSLPRTWAEWVQHVLAFCERCRLPYPPTLALLDLDALTEQNAPPPTPPEATTGKAATAEYQARVRALMRHG